MKPVTLPPSSNPRVPHAPYPYRHYIAAPLRFSDIDIFGHVNNNVYCALFDTAKYRYFEAVSGGTLEIDGIGIVVANINCNFLMPTLITDEIEVYTATESVHNRSFILDQRIIDRRHGATHATARSVMAGFDTHRGVSAPLPEGWVAALETFEQRTLRTQ